MALALKYRPQSFQDLVGQVSASRSLKNAIEHKRISHAYLFFGARGVGKTSTARILARSLNCEEGPTINPCGVCSNCKEIAAGQSMDVLEMDAASNRGIDHIRDLRETIRFAPMRSKYKIYIIDEVHMLTPESFNALLKTLEEPPEHVVFIMATTEIHKIPETILSRCQTFAFRKFNVEDIRSRLEYILNEEKILYEDIALYEIARRAEGSMRDSISILDLILAYAGTEKITSQMVFDALGSQSEETRLHFLDSIRKKDIRAALKIIDELYTQGQNLRRFVWDSMTALKDMALFHHETSNNPGGIFSQSQAKLIRDYANNWDAHELSLVFNLFYELYSTWSQFPNTRGSEVRVALEMGIFQIIHKLEQPSVSSLVSRLNNLKNSIETGKPFQDKPLEKSQPENKNNDQNIEQKINANRDSFDQTQSEKIEKTSFKSENEAVQNPLKNPYESKPKDHQPPILKEATENDLNAPDYEQDHGSILSKEFLTEPVSKEDLNKNHG